MVLPNKHLGDFLGTRLLFYFDYLFEVPFRPCSLKAFSQNLSRFLVH
ncbi:hypothetical protein ES703_06161 [subsurface metagenome]